MLEIKMTWDRLDSYAVFFRDEYGAATGVMLFQNFKEAVKVVRHYHRWMGVSK